MQAGSTLITLSPAFIVTPRSSKSLRSERPEKVKQEMAKDGSLTNLYIQMREQKALDKILESATVEDVDVAAPTAGEPTSAEASST